MQGGEPRPQPGPQKGEPPLQQGRGIVGPLQGQKEHQPQQQDHGGHPQQPPRQQLIQAELAARRPLMPLVYRQGAELRRPAVAGLRLPLPGPPRQGHRRTLRLVQKGQGRPQSCLYAPAAPGRRADHGHAQGLSNGRRVHLDAPLLGLVQQVHAEDRPPLQGHDLQC